MNTCEELTPSADYLVNIASAGDLEYELDLWTGREAHSILSGAAEYLAAHPQHPEVARKLKLIQARIHALVNQGSNDPIN